MPTLKLYVFEYTGPEPAKMLEQALAAVFPHGLPEGPGAAAVACEEVSEPSGTDTSDPVEEPTDLEPLDDPTVEEIEAPCATAELHAQELPAQQPAGRGGKIADARRRAIEWLRENGPAPRAEVGRECGVAKGSVPFAFHHPTFTITDEGLLWIAGEPEPVSSTPAMLVESRRELPTDPPEKLPVETAPMRTVAPVKEAPKRGPGRPPKVREEENSPIDGLTIDRGPVALCQDAIAAELVVDEPLSMTALACRTKFRLEIVAAALKSDRFRKSHSGYWLAAAKPSRQ